ncbi:MAG TPA: DUF1573 domain-containing protein [Cyclobacteriaceae bacterium]|nr:DUF1573 domain-containing protein [Cyclobacteriaceae bacterium]
MKKVVFFAALVLVAQVALGQGATTAKPKTDVAVVTVDNQNFDFGKIKQGVPATHRFMFTNTGKVPVVITNAQPSCGCTTPNWTKEPILPGGQGFVDATYSAASAGAFTKSITVTANTETGTIVLIIKGEVVAEPVNN